MVGANNRRCKEDERLLNIVLGSGKKGYIIDTRSQNLALLARTKGKCSFKKILNCSQNLFSDSSFESFG